MPKMPRLSLKIQARLFGTVQRDRAIVRVVEEKVKAPQDSASRFNHLQANKQRPDAVTHQRIQQDTQVPPLPRVIPTQSGVPVHIFVPDYERSVEKGALQQLISIAESGICEGFVAAMPDVHLGKGAAVGSVYASREFVAPNGVGVDIGCGMAAVPVEGLCLGDLVVSRHGASRRRESDHGYGMGNDAPQFHAAVYDLQRIMKERIPTGNSENSMHKAFLAQAHDTIERITREVGSPSPWLKNEILDGHLLKRKVLPQLGTLGGGNHFLEVVYEARSHKSRSLTITEDTTIDESLFETPGEQPIWLMLHSGSRWVGNNTASHHNEIAIRQMKNDGRSAKKNDRRIDADALNSLRIDSPEGQDYLQDMLWCQAYARENRRMMLKLMADSVRSVFGRNVVKEREINTHHNFCQCEECVWKDPKTGNLMREKLWVTRKGATAARSGQYGLIPGNMGVGSYIVKGRGNPDGWQSCSHGAGRVMSRTKAIKQVTQEDFVSKLKGIVCDRDEQLRDEAPQAYKNLSEVMRNQENLVDIIARLKPVINVKGIDKRSIDKAMKRPSWKKA